MHHTTKRSVTSFRNHPHRSGATICFSAPMVLSGRGPLYGTLARKTADDGTGQGSYPHGMGAVRYKVDIV